MRKTHLIKNLGLALILAAFGLLSIPAAAQTDLAIHAIQGTGNISPVNGQTVRVTGIVTARIRNGFFLQSPDDKADADPTTSEAIFVFTRTIPDAAAAVGNLISVTGKVTEYRRDNEPASLTLTQIVHQKGSDELKLISSGNQLPKPVTLAIADFQPNAIDQLEKYEAMRVRVAELSVVSPTDGRVDIKTSSSVSNGSFYGVLKGVARPFREPGLEIAEWIFMDEAARLKLRAAFPKITLFDTNPERLRIESMVQDAARPIDVSVGTVLSDVTGVLHYTYRTNTLLVDASYNAKPETTIRPNPMPIAGEREFSVVAMNIENFFDDRDDPKIKEVIVEREAFRKRLRKISLAFRNVLNLPDIVGVVEIESLHGLEQLAKQINADTVAAGKPDPKYTAHLIDGNDGRGIDNGYLVRTQRVKVLEIKQLGKDEKYKHPLTGENIFLNDRPPLLLRASVNDAKTEKPFEITAIVNHMKSYLGYNDPRQQDNVRLKKKLQAEYLAKIVQERQKADPAERIIVLGDFNSYQFSDGIMDMMGTIKGTPATPDSLMIASPDLVDPDLINLVDMIAVTQRYSYTFDGNAQVLDHILISETLRKHIQGFGFPRVNADYPEVFRNDESRPERFSDHDPAAAYFTLDPKQ